MKVSDIKKKQFTLLLNEKGGVIVSSKKDREARARRGDAWFYLGFVGEIGFTIALPLVAGALLGKFLDEQWSTYPNTTLLLLFAGGVVSVVGFIKTIQELIHKNT